ncbi:MAG TPA: YraN family protein [Desulfomonilaceae bacterium]|nr:YraN family protein [Desulfomonilaceae bacterium]
MLKFSNTREKGNEAERIASAYLAKNGYRIVERNFHCRVGEIDIIAQEGGDLVFLEVRSWHSTATVNPVYSVDRRKQNKIIKAAELYLAKHVPHPTPARFDVVIVKLTDPPYVQLIQDAFGIQPSGFID